MIQSRSHKKYLFTPLRYPGGKTSLFEFFDGTIKENGWKDIVYIEPYAGGAGAALSLLLLEKVSSIVINDYDRAIYAFWKSILDNPNEFIKRIEGTPVTVKEWENQKLVYKAPASADVLSLGFATFYLNRTNHSGVLNAGPIGGKAQTGNWKIDARYNKEALIARIKLISQYKDRISVSNKDGIEVIKEFATNLNSFLYIDPPYFVKGADLYLNAFRFDDHRRLAEILNTHAGAKWLLSYDNEKEIRELYPKRRQEQFTLKYSVHQKSKSGSEIMIFSDAIVQS